MTKKNKSIKEKIKNLLTLKNISIILPIMSALYFLINIWFNIQYSIDCEIFYKIPSRYFSTEIISKLFGIGGVIILYILPFIIYIKKNKNFRENKVAFVFFIFSVCTSYLYINTIYLKNIISIYGITCLDSCIFLTIFVFLNFLLYGYLYLYLMNAVGKKVELNDNVSVKNKGKIKFTRILFYLDFFCLFIILILEIMFPFISPIENKRKYEFVTTNDVDYVVLSHVDDKILICEYDEDNGKYEFFTSNYKLIDESGDMNYSYTVIDDKPTITTDKVKAKIVESSIKSSIDD